MIQLRCLKKREILVAVPFVTSKILETSSTEQTVGIKVKKVST